MMMAFPLQFSTGNPVLDSLQRRLTFAECKENHKTHTRSIRCNGLRGSMSRQQLRSKPIVPFSSARVRDIGQTRAAIAHDLLQTESTCSVFEGLSGCDTPVGICETRTLQPAISFEDALVNLRSTLAKLRTRSPPSESGSLRFQVPLPPGLKALQWLQSQPLSPLLLPRSYFSPRGALDNGTEGLKSGSSKDFSKLDVNGVGGVAGVGAAVLFTGSNPFSVKDWKAIKRFLSKDHPLIRAYGAMRFDPKMKPSNEWRHFGSFYFFIPQVEFCECEGCSLLAVTLTWDNKMDWPFSKALRNAFTIMQTVSTRISPDNGRPLAQVVQREHFPNEQRWHDGVNRTVQMLRKQELEQSDADGTPNLSNGPTSRFKVVMARRTKLEMNGYLDPISLLACLQDKDPSAYQFAIQVPDGSAFIGCSPERLFVRDGLLVASEAVAGTRARGSTIVSDLRLGLELLQSTKDLGEFEIVRERIKHQMETICKRVKIQAAKGLLKQARVQHLYARLNGELHDDIGEHDILSALHPTPAVCGHPQEVARKTISASEAFDRGLYAGPVGWIGGNDAEFAVGIRSSLVQPSTSHGLQNGHFSQVFQRHVRSDSTCADFENDPISRNFPSSLNSREALVNNATDLPKGTRVFLYAGVGVVQESVPAAEWQELELKTSQFEALLEQRQPLEKCVNINALWAKLIVEEFCRLGITYFCVAPGSRSSPITAAAAANPRVTCVPCIDERSMAFHAVGYGRGANKGAVVITSSGTAVSNLLPAVVEASQDFVPLVVLTADRPAELHDTGANQTIDQGKHFGGFVRYHVSLPAADDKVPAKMILTTIDAAVNRAAIAPSGPVHINCPFREPLAATAQAWSTGCLKGLERWTTTSAPYTQYIDSKPRLLGGVHPTFVSDLEGVGELIRDARKGLLVVGGLSAAEETWAVALLAQHLGWPLIPDVVSGLRIGEALCNGGVEERKVNIIHNFDQILLSKAAAESSKPDVVLQIGSRLTSKRTSQFLEAANLQAYILVEEHLYRHDPAHIVTHRIQSSVAEFMLTIMKVTKSKPPTAFCGELKLLSELVERKIHLMLQAESSLTEPFVAHYVVACLPAGSALFLGNSMPIRDVDMYAHGAGKVLGPAKYDKSWDILPHIGARVGANRGANGIDGVVSTAIGFAAGSRQRVTLLLGDVSFLHDTNGLTLLAERTGQPPLTIVVVNNCGGGIFSLLPEADTVPEESFSALYSTPHTVNLKNLCEAHRVNHYLVQSKEELRKALQRIHGSPLHWVIEVRSRIKDNADFHRFLNFSIGQSVTRASRVLLNFPPEAWDTDDHKLRILEANYSYQSFSLVAPSTTRWNSSKESKRQGFLLQVTLLDGSSGIGEVAPLRGVHKESLLDVEEQLRVTVQKIKGRVLTRTLPLLDGSFSHWLSTVVGIKEESLLPSVRIGLEMAILGAFAVSQECSLLELFSGISRPWNDELHFGKSPRGSQGSVRVCGLLDSEGTPENIADAAAQLVQEGFDTLKLKVGRRSYLEDATVIRRVRERVGLAVHLRADANRTWSFQNAKDFADAVQDCGLQYLEEPLSNPSEIPRFCLETGMPVALDESLDDAPSNVEEHLQRYASQGVVAVVIKPAVIGSFEKAWQIAQAAQGYGMIAVISSTFESSISLLAYTQFAAHVDEQWTMTFSATHDENEGGHPVYPKVAHGLGTYKWLKDNTAFPAKLIGNSIQISIQESAMCLRHIHLNMGIQLASSMRNEMISYNVNIHCQQKEYCFYVRTSAAPPSQAVGKLPTLVFLHGFLGNGGDWFLIMDALSTTFRCLSIDLPGHGKTTVEDSEAIQQKFSSLESSSQETRAAAIAENQDVWSIEGLEEALSNLFNKLGSERIVLVGYSMGARIALHMALRHSEQVSMAIIVSGSPGLRNASAQNLRAAQDDDLALRLRDSGLQSFVDWWYTGSLWKSLRIHPDFNDMKRSRVEHNNVEHLAKSLSAFSVGRQRPLWKDLSRCQVPLLLVTGECDTKFLSLAHQMVKAMDGGFEDSEELLERSIEMNSLGDHASNSSDGNQDLAAKLRQCNGSPHAPDFNVNPGVTRVYPPKLLVVEDSGHALHIESPLQLVRAIREFVMSSISQGGNGKG